jgi:ADP-ribose pyrophosphatase YjhB (NUDIX family)
VEDEVVVVVVVRDTNGVGVRNRNGVGVATCWAIPSGLANVSEARATAPWAVNHRARSNAAPAI